LTAKSMRVLLGCELSGVVRRAFRQRGHDAWSCDLLPASDGSPYHYECDVLDLLHEDPAWDLAVFFPPCTYLSASGMHWKTRGLRDPQLTEDALLLVRRLLQAPVPRIALENPVGAISSRIRPADQYVHPYQFGDDASKKTGLWLVNLPPLVPTDYIKPRIVNGRPRWANQTDGGQNKLGPSPDRAQKRGQTYPGLANAMAQQWGYKNEHTRNR